MRRRVIELAAVATMGASLVAAQAQPGNERVVREARGLLRDLVGIDTSEPNGSTTPAAERVAAYLRDAGVPAADVQVLGVDGRRGNVIARLRGEGRDRPALFLAHLDVVPASRQDWSVEPYVLTERDGYFYGRGTTDDKQFCAIWAAAFAQLAREKVRPVRDVILALTAGEEQGTGPTNGVTWLLAHHRALIDAAVAFNGDAGRGWLKDGRYLAYGVEAAEKIYVDFQLEATDAGGHSSRPAPGNPIYRLARGLQRLEGLQFPARLNAVTREFLTHIAGTESGATAADLRAAATADPDAIARLSKDPTYNSQFRTTCVATTVTAGHAPNALPQRARANVNCRLLPDDSVDRVRAAIVAALADPAIAVTVAIGPTAPPPQIVIDPRVMATITRAAQATWPGVPVMPVMEVGATDGLMLRHAGIPTYGLYHFESDENMRAHGQDERIGIAQFDEAVRFGGELLRLVAAGS